MSSKLVKNREIRPKIEKNHDKSTQTTKSAVQYQLPGQIRQERGGLGPHQVVTVHRTWTYHRKIGYKSQILSQFELIWAENAVFLL